MDYRVGFIGLGTIGFPICRNLAQSGADVAAYDVNPRADRAHALGAAGVRMAASLEDVARDRNVIVTVLPDSAAVETTLLNPELFERIERGTVCVEMSSGYPTTTIRIGRSLGARGVSMIDAPICNGSVAGAYERRITLCVGGDAAVLEQVRPMLGLIAKTFIHVGPLGSGHAVKIVNNAILMGFSALVEEAMALGVAYGIEGEKLTSTLRECSAANVQFDAVSRRVLRAPDGEVVFQLYLAAKDLRYASALAGELGSVHLVADALHNLYEIAERVLGPAVEADTAAWNLVQRLDARRRRGRRDELHAPRRDARPEV
ncbi:MAG TPA: NAD(P)-dependent oxidoreductase [bacterium]|nr:NAD(P)-dependent oxidoreductase [bacterium]